MGQINKTYYSNVRTFKIFGVEFFRIEDNSQRLDGKGNFIQETIPNKEYFESEFRIKKAVKDE